MIWASKSAFFASEMVSGTCSAILPPNPRFDAEKVLLPPISCFFGLFGAALGGPGAFLDEKLL